VRALVLELQAELWRSGCQMGERGIGLVHTTILRWVQHYTPEFEKRWSRFRRTVRLVLKIDLKTTG
jgi:transposase-like protein